MRRTRELPADRPERFIHPQRGNTRNCYGNSNFGFVAGASGVKPKRLSASKRRYGIAVIATPSAVGETTAGMPVVSIAKICAIAQAAHPRVITRAVPGVAAVRRGICKVGAWPAVVIFTMVERPARLGNYHRVKIDSPCRYQHSGGLRQTI